MNAVLICFFCIITFVPIFVNGLECYQCDICPDPFTPNNATIITTNNSSELCYKIAAAIITSRGAVEDCISAHIGDIGTWCCNTDLCNTAQSIVSMNLKILISIFLFNIGVIKMI